MERDVKNAERTRLLMRKIRTPLQQDFERYLKQNCFRNCLLAVLGSKIAVKICGPEVYSLRGKTVEIQGQYVLTFDQSQVNPSILNEYGMIRYVLTTFM